ncbi:MAG: carboxypeptidase-like regulatory domain-containing protein [Treponema sp.]|jgi:hypothetical protein|nr:carboxypeptidase-like regulatory domain-containing protein [Treponema sp.]
MTITKSRNLVPLLLAFPTLLAAALLGGCTFDTWGDAVKFPKELWGEWTVLMDQDFYTYRKVYFIGDTYAESTANRTAGFSGSHLEGDYHFTKISDRHYETNLWAEGNRTTVLLASRLPESSFTGRVLSPEGAPRKGLTVKVANNYNGALSETCTTGEDGGFTASGVIIGDPYTISAGGADKTFIPWFDGDNAGVLYTGGALRWTFGRKSLRGDLYAGEEYEFVLSVTNSGKGALGGYSYTFDYDPGRLEVTPQTGGLPSLGSGEETSLPLKITARLTETVEKIPLTLRFSGGGRTVEDHCLLRFYREEAEVRMVNDWIDTTAAILVPDNQGYVFWPSVVSTDGHWGSVTLPWIGEEYLIAVKQTGYPWADHQGLGAFWLGFNVEMNNVEAVLQSIEDMEVAAPMNRIGTATELQDVRDIRGFVHEGDIDFYRLRLTPESGGFVPVGD